MKRKAEAPLSHDEVHNNDDFDDDSLDDIVDDVVSIAIICYMQFCSMDK